MSDEFIEVLKSVSEQQDGHKYLLLYYILNPKLYDHNTKLTNETDVITFYPVGTYRTFSDAFKALADIMKRVQYGRFKIMHVGTSSTLNNTPVKSELNSPKTWENMSEDKLKEIHFREISPVEQITIERDHKDDINSIEYLRDNFSNLCFNTYALERLDEQHEMVLSSIKQRRENCWRYTRIHGSKDFEKLLEIYQERLPNRGESHLVSFFSQHLLDTIDGIPQILHKDDSEKNK